MRRIVGLAVVVGVLAWGQVAQAAPLKTYTYTGHPFELASSPFTTSDLISGFFTVDCGLAGGGGDCSSLTFGVYNAAVIDFSFSAGPLTIGSGGLPALGTDLSFSTSGDMNISSWAVFLAGDPTFDTRIIFSPNSDIAAVQGAGFGFASTLGSWQLTTGPEPTTLLLLGTGLAIAGYRRRRQVRR